MQPATATMATSPPTDWHTIAFTQLDELRDQLTSTCDRLKTKATHTLNQNPNCKRYLDYRGLDGDYCNAVYDAGYFMGLIRAVEIIEGYED